MQRRLAAAVWVVFSMLLPKSLLLCAGFSLRVRFGFRSYSVAIPRFSAPTTSTTTPSASLRPHNEQQQQQEHQQVQRLGHQGQEHRQVGTVIAKSGEVRGAYATLRASKLCGAQCVIVEAPCPEVFQFADTTQLQANHRVLYSARDDDITTEEVVFGRVKEQSNKARLNKFIGGRIALRRALDYVAQEAVTANSDLHISDSGSILRDSWGAPYLSPGITGSISHKDFLCVGAAAIDRHGRVGVDLEHCTNKAASMLSRRILTERERLHLGSLKDLGLSLEEEVLLTFSFKEAAYKAIHPFLARPIDFQEVEVFPENDGTAKFTFRLNTGENFAYQASWERFRSRYWLTCVYVNDATGKMDAAKKYEHENILASD